MRRERLLQLYPRAWRERYGEEFLATIGDEPISVQQVVDIVSGAIDAWFSSDVRRATLTSGVANGGGRSEMMRSLLACERQQHTRYTKADSLIGAAVMIGVTLFLTTLGVTARRSGWADAGEMLTSLSFPVSMTISMPFWLMKGQPLRAQLVIVGGTLSVLTVLGFLAAS